MVLSLAQFMVILDVTIVNVALPAIQAGLHFTADALQWVISAYTLVYGGFLLLGARAGDLFGRRSVLLLGMVLFGGTSLAGGLAGSPEMLIGMRAVQGLGAALMSPVAFSILMVVFSRGRARTLAVSIWGALSGLGGIGGVVLGGVLVNGISWRWVFLVNVPVAVLLLVLVPLIVPNSRAASGAGRRRFDVAGALLSTAGLFAIMLGVIRAQDRGWGSVEVIGLLVAGVVLLAAFLLVERRLAEPLVSLRLLRSRALSLASLELAFNGAGFLGLFFLLSVFLQQGVGLSALGAGLWLIPMGLAAIVSAIVTAQLATRVGTMPVLIAGSAISIAGIVLLLAVHPHTGFWVGVFPAQILFGIGLMAASNPAQVAAVHDIEHDHAGAASGIVNSGYQVGGAFGVAVASVVATSAHGGADAAFHAGLVVVLLFAVAQLVLSFAIPQVRPSTEEAAEGAVGA